MTVRHNCDTIENTDVNYGTREAVATPTVDGQGSILWTIPASSRQSWLGWSFPQFINAVVEPILRIHVYPAHTMPVEIGIRAGNWAEGERYNYYAPIITDLTPNQWNIIDIDMRTMTPGDTSPPLDDYLLAHVHRVVARLENMFVDTTCNVDSIETLPAASLSISSSDTLGNPLNGIPFNVDGTPYTTPLTDEPMSEGLHTVNMPATWSSGVINFAFSHWADDTGNTIPSRDVNLTGNMAFEAVYTQSTFRLSVDAYENTNSLVIPFTIDGTQYSTPLPPLPLSASPNQHIIEMPPEYPAAGLDGKYVFDHWVDSLQGPSRQIELSYDMGITAVYRFEEIVKYRLTVNSIPDGIPFILQPVGGTKMSYVTPWWQDLEPGEYDITLTLASIVVSGQTWTFQEWQGADSVAGLTARVNLTDTNREILAVYQHVTKQLEIVTPTNGTTDPIPAVYPDMELNEQVPITALPDAGYELDHWELDTVDVGSANPYTVTMDADHSILAVFRVLPPQPLQANAGGPYYALPTDPAIQFVGGAVGGQPPYTAWLWNFGDGATSNEQSPVHTYPTTENAYTVTLTVTDSLGATDSATTTATISSTPPEFPEGHTRIWLFVHSLPRIPTLWNFPLIEIYDNAAKQFMPDMLS